ncbi:dTDP-4-dehydrorhamnose 3,5-epimerase family protein [Streptomyces sp. NBS 14/10]|uniref:dTDP-4-dehydrorhamnose 3,5-epimerase family protein n=1 Tax=Streptomyces sp. NBS 14/10 TaxID=1945643 RepID=UPI000B7EEDD6|nr:dTDP-4-dehydrorhamnose 3,5-epimerase family protein [Streptomyces sp. NBS 14/10]KAK1179444.1 dTDP-4-dehydrorhamnose 3,5-epimerase family protein [Streptomyces sp. NBS 14/10]NUS88562.1 dTDP-4-dehydrorhamnose 3,5-epimerase family protein [Streptomyces sp.]
MEIHETAVPDAYRIVPRHHTDARGSFFESYAYGQLARQTGHVFVPLQVNYSVSARNTLRGVHGVRLPPGQAKFVTCVRGALLDVVVDLRLGSPTFGAYDTNTLDADEGTAMYVAEGLGHGFVALTDDTCISYLCSTQYVPGTQIDLQPLDPALGLPWHLGLTDEPLISEKDARAPSLAEATGQGLLATYDACRNHYERQLRAADAAEPTAHVFAKASRTRR